MRKQEQISHVLIFPLPIQGHVNSMLKLAELLCLSNLHVTFLNSVHNHDRLLRFSDIRTRFDRYPGFVFETFPDGLPEDHPRSGDRAMDIFYAIDDVAKPLIKELFKRLVCDTVPPVTFVIADVICEFVHELAQELGIPTICFRTNSCCCSWVYYCLPKLIDAGELPLKGKEDLDRKIEQVPGMETILRGRDLPSFCRHSDVSNRDVQLVLTATQASSRAHALILNTFEDLDAPLLSHIRRHFPKVFTIGPLHSHLKYRLSRAATTWAPSNGNSLWEEDKSCIPWLNTMPFKSVIYVSFGSITVLSKDQMFEFWHGLVNSGKPFLWVIRPDSIIRENGSGHIPAELSEATKKRGYMVEWVPQEEVLSHPAIGGFLTHSGWNSTIESLVAGVPMICWPHFADQLTNSRLVSEVWKVGLDMKDTCDRLIVEKMVRDLLDDRSEEFLQATKTISGMARKSVSEGGSSYLNLDRLVEEIRLMRGQPLHSTTQNETYQAENCPRK
ncbi:UDP-glucuronosyl/UDP-glucosyltransferase [Dillenia turbinata]|uniref:Glycosyltransferase n=1 Tax=Dillenia turbinata TaxID=194707 RepID=A0AAN8ZCS9_9MAGN